MHQKSVKYAIIRIFYIKVLNRNHICTMVVMMLLLSLLKEVITEFLFYHMSKDDEISIMNNSSLNQKTGSL